MRPERLRVRDVEVEVIRGGSGRPVLLLHGPMTYRPEAPFLALLAEHAEVIAPSHPGFGGTPRTDRVETMYDLVQFYRDLLDALPIDQVSLIGCSFGGWLAAELATSYGRRLDRLVLVDPVGIKASGREERDIVHIFNTAPAEISRLAWHDPSKQRPGSYGLGWQLRLDEMRDEEMVVAARNWDALCLYAWRPHLYNPRLKHWLHRITVPTLVVWGAGDGIVTTAYGQAYSRLIPGSRLEIIPEAGHHPELEQPEAFVERVVRFLSEGEPTP